MSFQELIDEIKEFVLDECDADDTIGTIQRSIDENIDLCIGNLSHDDTYEIAKELGLVDFEALQAAIFEQVGVDAWEMRKDLQEKADEATRLEAIDNCYYAEPSVCDGELWECQTCHNQYCESHWHETDLGEKVECVACERERKERENLESEEDEN
jgi:hypothetical protein